jgi:hypothetical protein
MTSDGNHDRHPQCGAQDQAQAPPERRAAGITESISKRLQPERTPYGFLPSLGKGSGSSCDSSSSSGRTCLGEDVGAANLVKIGLAGDFLE